MVYDPEAARQAHKDYLLSAAQETDRRFAEEFERLKHIIDNYLKVDGPGRPINIRLCYFSTLPSRQKAAMAMLKASYEKAGWKDVRIKKRSWLSSLCFWSEWWDYRMTLKEPR